MDLLLQLEVSHDSHKHLIEALNIVQASPSPDKMKGLEETDEYIALMIAFESFCNDTKAGKHSVNAQFWMNY